MTSSLRVTLAFFLAVFVLNSCDEENQSLPELTTTPPTYYGGISAETGGKIITTGTSPITEQGVCWSVNPAPTIFDDILVDSSGEDEFELEIRWLTGPTTYYVRSYAKTADGVAYGQEESFTTPEIEAQPSDGFTAEDCENFVNQSTTDVSCCVSGNLLVTAGETVQFKLSTDIDNPQITWHVYSGSMNIIDGQGTMNVSLKIEDDFSSGILYVNVEDSDSPKGCRTGESITLK